MESCKGRVKLARRRADLISLPRKIGTLLASNIARKEELSPLVTGDRYFLRSCGCPNQSRNSNLKIQKR